MSAQKIVDTKENINRGLKILYQEIEDLTADKEELKSGLKWALRRLDNPAEWSAEDNEKYEKYQNLIK